MSSRSAHSRKYIEIRPSRCRQGLHTLTTGDTQICPRTLDVALRAVGGVLNAVDAVVGGKRGTPSASWRPPGHQLPHRYRDGLLRLQQYCHRARHAQKKFASAAR